VVVRLALSSLDPWLTHGGPVRAGSRLVGLRGQTGTLAAATAHDVTRGSDGPFFVCQELLAVSEPETHGLALGAPAPNPGHDGVTFAVNIPRATRVDLAVFDAQGRCVRSLRSGTLEPGVYRMSWDGRDGAGRPAGSGAYFIRLSANGETRARHVVLVR
jgi:hypothetical protein